MFAAKQEEKGSKFIRAIKVIPEEVGGDHVRIKNAESGVFCPYVCHSNF